MEFEPVPCPQTPHGNFDFSTCCGVASPLLQTTLVFPMLTLRPLPSRFDFQHRKRSLSSSNVSAAMTRSSAYKSSHGHPWRNSRETASMTMANRRGLSTDPWCKPTLTMNSSLRLLPSRTLDFASSYNWDLLYHSNERYFNKL